MLPQLKQSPLAAETDTQLEWLLCLTAALQASQQQTAEFLPEPRLPAGPVSLRGLQALPKRRPRAGRNRAA